MNWLSDWKAWGWIRKAMRLRVAEMASYFGIQDWFYKDVGQLSGGQKQLLNLASIMAMQPDVLILDEPTSQLDPIAAADFLNTVRKINLELGTTILITEHRLEDIYHAGRPGGRHGSGADPDGWYAETGLRFSAKTGARDVCGACRRRCRCIMGSVACRRRTVRRSISRTTPTWQQDP